MADRVTFKLPTKELSNFIDAAVPWLRKSPDFKAGAELRLAVEDNQLNLSIGCSSHYVEASVPLTEPVLLQYPLFLDLQQLANFEFDEDTMEVSAPAQVTKSDQKVQFRGGGIQFKIPVRKGDLWEIHNQKDLALDLDSINGFDITADFFNRYNKNLNLPNAFKIADERAVMFRNHGTYVDAYFVDIGAFCHSFSTQKGLSPNFQDAVLKIPYSFLMPYENILKKQENISVQLRQDSNQTYGLMQGSLFSKFIWIQPNHIKPVEDVAGLLKELRKNSTWSCVFDAKEFKRNVEKVTTFFSEKDMQRAVFLNILGDRYALSTEVSSIDMKVEGTLAETAPQSVKINIQAGCLLSYLKLMTGSENINIEFYSQSTVMYQQVPDGQLVYWLPAGVM